MNTPSNTTLKKYAITTFIPFFLAFLYFYFKEGFSHTLTRYCFIICLLTGISYVVRDYLK